MKFMECYQNQVEEKVVLAGLGYLGDKAAEVEDWEQGLELGRAN